jgi:hypothetical protein
MMKNNSYVSLISGLTLWTLVILKVSGTIDISWLWVFAPIWLPIVLLLSVTLLGILFVVIIEVLDEYVNSYKK